MTSALKPTLGDLSGRFDQLAATPGLAWPIGDGPGAAPKPATAIEIGRSRAGRPIFGHRIGRGPTRVSILAGCHADEPVGPRLAGKLVPYLESLPANDPLVAALEWWVIPHINPDGAQLNASWQRPEAPSYSLAEFLSNRVRELPGDDIEFGFPRETDGHGARPENTAAACWWTSSEGPFDLHVTLHGMAFAAGPWFLLEPAWIDRTVALRDHCARRVSDLGYRLHDVDRRGEKGFSRIEPGFCTRPDSSAMRQHFLAMGDSVTADRFYPNSMEFMRSVGGDPLTLVSEMPLFLLPGVGEELGPPDPAMEIWKTRIASWTTRSGEATEINREAGRAGLRPMPVIDQMRLQWEMISAAIATVVQRH